VIGPDKRGNRKVDFRRIGSMRLRHCAEWRRVGHERDRHVKKKETHVGDGLIQFLEGDVERLAVGAAGLLVFSHSFHIEPLQSALA
jgi:hypothetical protein